MSKELKLSEEEIKDLKIHILEKTIKELENYIKENPRFIQLEILDKDTGRKHIIGTNPHDCLLVVNGKVEYYNLQNGCSSPETYEFVEKNLYD